VTEGDREAREPQAHSREPETIARARDPHEDERIEGESHPIARMILIGVVASLIGIAIVLAIPWFPEQGDTAAGKIDTLYDVLLVCSVPVFVLVMTIVIYCVVKFRARPGDMRDGPPIHGNTRLEIIWVTIPFIMVTALAIYGWVVLDDIEAKQPNEMVVKVEGRQFAWRFHYPADKVQSSTLTLPKDRPVEFRINTDDVLHDFWVPEFRLKSDAVPGITTKIRLTPNKLGHFRVVCAELCGLGHATMRADVRVVPPAEFTSWLSKQKKEGS
jgi:cytochrome c oxidase subunit II